jgi:predicted MFS family arabinose efflux permease
MYLAVGALGASLVLSVFVDDNPVMITALMLIYVVGLVVPPTLMFARAMDMHPALRASASSLIQSCRMLFMAIGTAVAGALYNDTYLAPVAVMFVFVTLSVPFAKYAMRHAEQDASQDPAPALAMH